MYASAHGYMSRAKQKEKMKTKLYSACVKPNSIKETSEICVTNIATGFYFFWNERESPYLDNQGSLTKIETKIYPGFYARCLEWSGLLRSYKHFSSGSGREEYGADWKWVWDKLHKTWDKMAEGGVAVLTWDHLECQSDHKRSPSGALACDQCLREAIQFLRPHLVRFGFSAVAVMAIVTTQTKGKNTHTSTHARTHIHTHTSTYTHEHTHFHFSLNVNWYCLTLFSSMFPIFFQNLICTRA